MNIDQEIHDAKERLKRLQLKRDLDEEVFNKTDLNHNFNILQDGIDAIKYYEDVYQYYLQKKKKKELYSKEMV